eukprot:2159393-Prymnesium_polylepis.1
MPFAGGRSRPAGSGSCSGVGKGSVQGRACAMGGSAFPQQLFGDDSGEPGRESSTAAMCLRVGL